VAGSSAVLSSQASKGVVADLHLFDIGGSDMALNNPGGPFELLAFVGDLPIDVFEQDSSLLLVCAPLSELVHHDADIGVRGQLTGGLANLASLDPGVVPVRRLPLESSHLLTCLALIVLRSGGLWVDAHSESDRQYNQADEADEAAARHNCRGLHSPNHATSGRVGAATSNAVSPVDSVLWDPHAMSEPTELNGSMMFIFFST
jgi:hypothetical protein